MPVSVAALVFALAPGCCLTGGWHECDSATFVGGCDGQRYSTCVWSSNPWSGVYEELVEGECRSDEVCVSAGSSGAGCVLAPATPCDPETHPSRCDGVFPVVCAAPGAWSEVSYEIRTSPCAGGLMCGTDGSEARCLRPSGVPCPYAAPRTIGCGALDVVFCERAADGSYVEGMHLECPTGCVEVSENFAECR